MKFQVTAMVVMITASGPMLRYRCVTGACGVAQEPAVAESGFGVCAVDGALTLGQG